jgi:predicted transposase YbfD/YdcC
MGVRNHWPLEAPREDLHIHNNRLDQTDGRQDNRDHAMASLPDVW